MFMFFLEKNIYLKQNKIKEDFFTMSRRPLATIDIIQNTVQPTPSRTRGRRTTTIISRGIGNIIRNRDRVCALTHNVLSKIQKIRFQIDQDNTTECIMNRNTRTGSVRVRRDQRELFWHMPELDLHRYRDWVRVLNGWKMFCVHEFDENTHPDEIKIWRDMINNMLMKLKKMDKKCQEWNRFSFR